jgi:4-amino-4-deoxy-L-arabinose transferase-like glycosyltransferase
LRDDELRVSPTAIWRIFWIAAGSFVPMLFLQYVGEEAVYTLGAQEMVARGNYLVATLYGDDYVRPGIYSWLIAALTSILGPGNILISARLITIASTILMGLILAWLIRRIFKDPLLAALAAAVFLSGDVLLYRGWLAYADPFFSLCTFGAMACLWVATEERRDDLLALAGFALICSFLAKALTGFVFYGVLGLVLLWRHDNRIFLVRPWSFIIHSAAITFPFVWNYAIAKNDILDTMILQILSKPNNLPPLLEYLKLLIGFPFRTIWYLLPVSVIAIYCLAWRKTPLQALAHGPIAIAIWALIINLIPYWTMPQGGTRYLMPVYPLVALMMAAIVLHSGKYIVSLTAKALIGTVVVAYMSSLIGFPLYEHYFRGSYTNAAKTIIARAGEQPIYVTDATSIGLSIAANINVLRATKSPIVKPPGDFSSGYVLAMEPDPNLGQVDLLLGLGHNRDGRRTRYLLCRGAACSQSR